MKYSKGLTWINDCRIPFKDDTDKSIFNYNSEGINRQKTSEAIFSNIKIIGNHSLDDTRQEGRFPPNLLVCDDALNDGNISISNSGGISSGNNFGGLTKKYRDRKGIDDKGSNSRYYDLDLWFNNLIENL